MSAVVIIDEDLGLSGSTTHLENKPDVKVRFR